MFLTLWYFQQESSRRDWASARNSSRSIGRVHRLARPNRNPKTSQCNRESWVTRASRAPIRLATPAFRILTRLSSPDRSWLVTWANWTSNLSPDIRSRVNAASRIRCQVQIQNSFGCENLRFVQTSNPRAFSKSAIEVNLDATFSVPDNAQLHHRDELAQNIHRRRNFHKELLSREEKGTDHFDRTKGCKICGNWW